VILLLSYALGFVLPVAGAIMSLAASHHGAHAHARTDSIGAELVNDAIPLALSLLAATLGMRSAARAPLALRGTDLGLRRPAAISRDRAAGTALMYLATITAASILGDALVHLFGVEKDAATAPTDRLAAALADNAWAGLLEEPILLGLTLGLALRLRWRWQLVLPLMIVMRLAFHVYYGPIAAALFVVPWMCGAYLLYRRCPLLWPFVLAHGAYDVLVTLNDNASHAAAVAATLIQDTLAILGVLVALYLVVRHLHTHGPRRGDPDPAPAPA
jgi:hypothetical protein